MKGLLHVFFNCVFLTATAEKKQNKISPLLQTKKHGSKCTEANVCLNQLCDSTSHFVTLALSTLRSLSVSLFVYFVCLRCNSVMCNFWFCNKAGFTFHWRKTFFVFFVYLPFLIVIFNCIYLFLYDYFHIILGWSSQTDFKWLYMSLYHPHKLLFFLLLGEL